MRRLILLVLLIIIVPSSACSWHIADYDVLLNVRTDGVVEVTERIVADFTNDPHHGIYRDIPLGGIDAQGRKMHIGIDVVSVTDGQGSNLQTEITRTGSNFRIRIGSPDFKVDGLRTYVIKYNAQRAVLFFEAGTDQGWSSGHDEIYWNAIGNAWDVRIENASCIVKLPNAIPVNDIRATAFTGTYGQKTSNAKVETPSASTVVVTATQPLNPFEGLTVAVGWPKGVVAPPSAVDNMLYFLRYKGFFFLPIIFVLGLIWLWHRQGRDPDTGRSEAVMYDPPDDLDPAELGTLIDEKVDMRDISASIISLAVRGYIHIKDETTKAFLSVDHDYLLTLTKPYDEIRKDPKLSEFEQELVSSIFAGGQFKRTSELKNSFYVHIPDLKDKLYHEMMKRGYFNRRPDKVRTSYFIGGIVLIIIGVAMAFISESGESPGVIALPWEWGAAVAVCGALLMGASRTMPKKTARGKNVLLAARGFEEYLTRAEKDQIELQERQNYFDKFLPYAIALGVADRWAKAFDGLATQPPQWYTGQYDTFHPTIFARHMNTATTSMASTMVSQPRSSGGSGGGSGFSGGFSGGGFGGGGGGGW